MKKYLILLGLASAALLYSQIDTGGSGGGGTGTVTSVATTSPIAGGTITTTGTLTCPTCIVSTAPGAGLAHFAGSTQTATSSAVVEADQTLADNTTNDVSTTKHGYAPKSPNDATKFLDGTGVYTVPPGTGAGKFALQAYCTGAVGTSNATSYYLTPGTTTPTCTATSLPAGNPMSFACTAKNLYVVASAAGGQAGSGLVALRKGGTPQALTCTLGTGTTCNDTTHTASYVAGDTWAVSVFTGQATDTTANVRVSFECD